MKTTQKTPGKPDRKRLVRRADLLLIAVLAVMSAAALIVPTLITFGKDADSGEKYVTVTVAGELYGRYSLSSDAEIVIENGFGRNILTVSGGKASVSDSDCPGGDCVKTAPIDRIGESIVCLPHRLTVTVTDGGGDSEREDGIDFII